MKRSFMLLIVLFVTILLSACTSSTDSELIEFADYDFTNLTMCLDAMMDEDDETICSQEDSNTYLKAYADYFTQYLDPQLITNASMSYLSRLVMNIAFEELPTSFGQDSIDIMNQVVEKINSDISDIILNDLGYVVDVKPTVNFTGVKIAGIFEAYDIQSFLYMYFQGTKELYISDMKYYEDTVLTEDFDKLLDCLEETLESQSANRFTVRLSNGTEYVMVSVNKEDSEFSIYVSHEGLGNTTDLTVSDFLSQVSERFSGYSNQSFQTE